MDAATGPSNVSFFQQQWQTYRRVVDHNYMRHHELGQLLQNWFCENVPEPFSLLDLGCGDAWFTAEAIKFAQVSKYVGVDLCAPALQLAVPNLSKLEPPAEFMECDIAHAPTMLQEKGDKFDVVLASFSVHHLKLAQKAELLAAIKSVLASDGVFLMIDAVRRKDETRHQFYERYMRNVRAEWTALSPAEIQSIEEHITSSDYPETFDTLRGIGIALGYHVERLDLGPNYSDQVVEFSLAP